MLNIANYLRNANQNYNEAIIKKWPKMAIIKKIYKQRNPGEDVEKREPTVVGIVS